MNKTLSGSTWGLTCAIVAAAAMTACMTTGSAKPDAPDASSARQSQAEAEASRKAVPSKVRQAQARSSLDALRRGEPTGTPAESSLKEIYFGFDSFDLSTEARATLRSAADWLRSSPAVWVEIEGHCDTRGTSEYNLALGARRAQAAKDYLVSLGVAADRVSTISYGEEIPVCRDNHETCWQRNRRARLVVLAPRPGV